MVYSRTMFTLSTVCEYTQEIKRSHFRAFAAPVEDEQAARDFITAHSDGEANHNCWAWRIGQAYRFSDDGEPSGTAGKPILAAIDGRELDRVAVVVTRWFGGILLGSGGLVRAYGGTAALCLQSAEMTRIIPSLGVRMEITFSDLALVKARLLTLPDVRLNDESFIGTGAILDFMVPEAGHDDFLKTAINLTSGRAIIHGND